MNLKLTFVFKFNIYFLIEPTAYLTPIKLKFTTRSFVSFEIIQNNKKKKVSLTIKHTCHMY